MMVSKIEISGCDIEHRFNHTDQHLARLTRYVAVTVDDALFKYQFPQSREGENFADHCRTNYRLRLPQTPRSQAREASRRDAGNEPRALAQFSRRKFSVRSDINPREALEQRHCTAFGNASLA